MVRQSALLSMPRPVLGLSSPAPNARLAHVEVDKGDRSTARCTTVLCAALVTGHRFQAARAVAASLGKAAGGPARPATGLHGILSRPVGVWARR
jgi:hypothetical protein